MRELDLVLNKAHFGEYDTSIRLLVNFIEKQADKIENLQNELATVKQKMVEKR